jgi:hypothetical protein
MHAPDAEGSVMHRVLHAFVVSCAAMASLAAAPASAGSIGFTAYASVAGPEGGFEYVRLFPGDVVLSQLDHALLSGAFANGDYSTEYAIDDTLTLVKIDTATGVVTSAGALIGFDDSSHISFTIDSGTGLAYALVARSPCTSSDFYGVDLTNGTTLLIGAVEGCMQSMVYAADGTIYALDRHNGNLATLFPDVADIGSIGLTLDDADTLAFAPGSDILLLFAFNPDLGTNVLYSVDTSTGAATLIGSIGGADPMAAVALGGPLPDAIFDDGFEG